jgi:hypothetical protein
MKPATTEWKITYTKDGEERTTTFMWSDQTPTENDVATGIRDELLSEIVIFDRTRGSSNHSVAMLEGMGFKIVGIERAASI